MDKEIDFKGKSCYIYTRVSTDIQVEGYSLEAQTEDCRKFAEYKGMKVANIYSDEGKSGKDVVGRNQFLQMMSDIEIHKDDVSAVLVFKLSRFGRNATDTLRYVELLKQNDVTLFAVKDSVDSSSQMGKFMITILSAVSEMERINIREQTQSGRIQKARTGRWNGGLPPMGYTLLEGGRLEVNEEEAVIVREIFDLYVNKRLTVNAITNAMNVKYKKPARQKNNSPKFSAQNIRKILDNDTYHGYITYGKTYTLSDGKTKSGKPSRRKQLDETKIVYEQGEFEPIIDEITWALAKERREDEIAGRKFVRKAPDTHVYPLSGLIICPGCGRNLNGHINHGKISKKTGIKGEPTYDYGCKNHSNTPRGQEKCPFSRQLNEEKLCAEVLKIINEISLSDKFTRMVAEKINAAVDVSDLEDEKTEYEKQRRVAQSNLDILSEQFDGLDPFEQTFDVKRDNLQKRIDSLYITIAELDKCITDVNLRIKAVYDAKFTFEKIYKLLKDFNTLYSKFTDEEKRTCLQLLIEKIEIQNFEAKPIDYSKIIKSIKFRFPLNDKEAEASQIYLTNETANESVILLVREMSTSPHITIEVTPEDLGDANLRFKGTYEEIKAYVFEKYRLKVSTLNIAQTKRKMGLDVGEAYMKPKNPNAKQPPCPPEKEKAIIVALKHFGMI